MLVAANPVPLEPKVEDIKNLALSEVKIVKAEDVKDVKSTKIEDSKDSKPVNITKDGDKDGEVVCLGVNRVEPPAPIPFGIYKAESRDTGALPDSQQPDTLERSPDDIAPEGMDVEPTGTAEQPRGLSPLPDYQDIDMNRADESITPEHDQEDNEMLMAHPSGEEINTTMIDEQSITNDRAELLGPPPRKKPRVVLDAIVLPTLASVLKKRVLEKAMKKEIEEKIKMLSNPIVKKKKNMELSIDTVRERLKSIGYDLYPVPLDKAIQDVTVTRHFISEVYGGSPVGTFPTIAKDGLALHGVDNFMFLRLDLNPQAPQIPGAPGLIFDVDSNPGEPAEEIEDKRIFKMFARLDSAVWQYCGNYMMKQVVSLTKEEWAEQSANVRNAWARYLCVKPWGLHSRARVHLRQTLNREPTAEEVDADLTRGEAYKHIVPAQIHEAFLRGKETIAVSTLRCVGYDTTLQRNLAEKFPTWVPPPPKEKKNKKPVTKKGKVGKKAPKATVRKRKHADLESSDGEESTGDEEDYLEDEDEELIEHIYVARGTRSRPIPIE